jgi:putative Holliday junction resolvase
MRIMAVDPGDKRLGLAVSDPTGTIANPLTVLKHQSRLVDAATIASIASEQGVSLTIVGATYELDGELTPQGRKANRLAEAIRTQTDLPVTLWDEAGSTQAARSARIQMGVKRSKRSGHLDELAAVVILQSYLESGQTRE